MKNHIPNKSLKSAILGSIILSVAALISPLHSQMLPPLPGPSSELIISTQTEIDTFNAVYGPVLDKGLKITDDGSDPITNLDGLSSLILVLGSVTIENNPSLDRFCGLYTLINSNGLMGGFVTSGNLLNPDAQDIKDGGVCTEPAEEILSLEEIIEAFVDDGVLNKGLANSLTKQAGKSMKALMNHLNALVKAGVLTEEEALLVYNAAVLES
jgi:hypothetical protein